jgi:hypothetical protein
LYGGHFIPCAAWTALPCAARISRYGNLARAPARAYYCISVVSIQGVLPMRKMLTVLALIAAVSFFAARPAQAQQGSDGGVVVATLAGVVVGGALVYYYYPINLLTTTALGAVVGGAIGNWWYNASEGGDIQSPVRRSNGDAAARPFKLIKYSEERPALRLAE